MALQPLLLPIISLFKSAGITQARSAMLGLNKDFTSFATSVGKSAGAFAAFQGLAGAREFALTSIEQTQRFERNLLALRQVFEDVTPQLSSFIKEVESYGLSQSQAAQASVFLGSVLKQYGFSVQESADQTERLVTLAQDLATTYGYDVQDSLLAITALFRGEYDPIEKFGVAMKQNEINAYLAAQGLNDLEGQERLNAEATARLTLLFDRAGDSVGAYSRAVDTLYVAQQNLNAVMENMQVAFGAPLQQPIAEIINYFAELAQKYGPEVVEIGRALGVATENLTPLLKQLGETFFLVLAPLEQVVRFVGTLGGILVQVLAPAVEIVNQALGAFNTLLNFLAIKTDQWAESLDNASESGSDFSNWLNDFVGDSVIIGFFTDLAKSINDNFVAMQEFVDQTRNNEFTEASRDVAMLRNAIANYTNEAEAAVEVDFNEYLRELGLAADAATGTTSGLSLAIQEVEDAAAKSNAKKAMEEIGLSAGLIEKVLTEPDWAGIFGAISELARLTAIDLANVFSVTAAAGISNRIAELRDYLGSAFEVDPGTTGAAATDAVANFFDNLDDEVAKQTARRKLAGMGASEGLISSILGTSGWEKVFDAIIKGGVEQLQALQDEFNRTAAGITELNRLQEEAAQLLQEQQDAADAATEALQRQQDEYDALIERLQEFKDSIGGIALGGVLATIEEEIGRFEQATIASFDKIQSSLASALDNGLIFEMAYNQLVAFANKEQQALQQIARQRDELAAKGDWVENLLRDYRNAFTAALNLTGVLNQIENKTTEITISEVTRGSARVGDAIKDLSFTLTRSYTQTITETVNKTQALVDNFRNVAEKARAFAGNLETLRKLGLDPMLFNQLIEAGVEAGGETAQALVDGGSETIKEINSLFKEIGDTGIAVGESVAEDFYLVGENFGSELLDGIRSQQAQFEETARQMAQAFEDNFQVQVGRATQQVADVANLESLKDQLEAEQKRIEGRLLEQEAILTGGTAGPGSRAWAVKKTESYNEQLAAVEAELERINQEIISIPVTPLARGGITLGSTLAMIGENGPEAVIPLDKLKDMKSGGGNVYNVYVTADTRVGGSKAGEAIVQQLKQFEDRNGPIGTVLTVN